MTNVNKEGEVEIAMREMIVDSAGRREEETKVMDSKKEENEDREVNTPVKTKDNVANNDNAKNNLEDR